MAEPQRNSFPAEIRFQRTPAEQAIPTEGLRIRLTDSGLYVEEMGRREVAERNGMIVLQYQFWLN